MSQAEASAAAAAATVKEESDAAAAAAETAAPLAAAAETATTTASASSDTVKEEGSNSSASGGEKTAAASTSKEYQQLIEYGLDAKVASRLDEIFRTGELLHSDLDDRALDALKEFPSDGALAVLAQFLESNLEHVSNKSAYLCGVMKTYRQKSRARGGGGAGGAAVGGAGAVTVSAPADASSSAAGGGVTNGGAGAGPVAKGPDEAKINEILARTGYNLDVTTGQRKFGGPPPGWEGEPPGNGCEVFCGKIPRDIYESDLIPLFEKCGTIWDLRLMMDPMTGLNRGYAFVTFTTRDAAQEAVRQLDSYELGEGKALKINVSEPKTRLFIGNIPKSKGREEIEDEFRKMSAGLREVIIYSSPDDKKKNRGFCFLEYESHKAASLAKRRLETGRVKVWNCDIIVDWADPQEEPDEHTMSQVKVLYVRNLTAMVTEEKIREVFGEQGGSVERVKKIKDYAFVHFEDRDQAVQAMQALNGQDLCGSDLQISLAKPPSDKKKKEEILRKREQRMMRAMSQNIALPPFPFAGAYGPLPAAAAAAVMFRGPGAGGSGGQGGRGGGQGGMRGGGAAGGLHRGFENGWHWGGWSGDGSWPVHGGRGGAGAGAGGAAGPMTPWMGVGGGENWAGLGGRGGGGGGGHFPWGNGGGGGVNGNAGGAAVAGGGGNYANGGSRVDGGASGGGQRNARKGGGSGNYAAR